VEALLALRSKEIKLEEAIGNGYLEDFLIDKRLWIISPPDFYDFGYDWEIPVEKKCRFLNHTVKPRLAKFRSQLRDRFDYRLLVDWGYRHLWKQLYVVYQTQNQREKDAIK
jgi:hypothetical protein